MLCLERKVGETVDIRVGEIFIRVTVCRGGRGERVKLGFDAPREVEIDRTEVFKSKLRQRLKDKENHDGV